MTVQELKVAIVALEAQEAAINSEVEEFAHQAKVLAVWESVEAASLFHELRQNLLEAFSESDLFGYTCDYPLALGLLDGWLSGEARFL